MKTRKLFYEDCQLKTFTASVLSCTRTDKGYAVILDQTAFYPEGGGQACDLGCLGSARVLDVREDGETIVHLCDQALTGTVTGTIDWDRRFDQMQQHAGEHIVSGIIHRRFGYHNVGFHVGADVVTIDFDGPITVQALAEIEEEANAAIWQDLPVVCWYPAREELPTVAYRSKKDLPWPVRIVRIPGCDTCACCGVHVKTTGQIGFVKLLSCVKFHQGVRIEMAAGRRALDFLSRVYEQNRLVSQAFSAKILETGAAAQKMNDALTAEKFRSTGLQKQVFSAVAEGYREAGNVLHFAEDLTSGAVRELADAIAAVCGGTAAVFCNGSVCLVDKTKDVKDLGNRMAGALDGRGGGKPGFFQGSVRAGRAQIEAFFAQTWPGL